MHWDSIHACIVFQLIAYWFIRIAFILAGFPHTICGFFLPTPWIFFPLGIVHILWLTHRVTRYNICYSNRKQIMKRIPKNIYLCTSDKFIAVRIRRHRGEEYMNIVQLVGCQFPAIFWCNIIIYQLCVHIFFSLVRNHINAEKIKIILRIFRWDVGIQLHIQKKITFITYISVTKYEKLKIQWLNEIFDTSKLSVRAYENISVEK